MKQVALKLVFALLLACSPFFSSAYNDGDLGSAGGTWSAPGSWVIYSGGTWTVTGARVPLSTDTVYILSGTTVTVDLSGSGIDSCYNLIVESGATLYSNDQTAGNEHQLNVYGTFISDSGVVGNPGFTDDIVFDIEGHNCTISGLSTATFQALRIRKSSKTLPAANNTNLTISMNIRLTYNEISKCADIYNNVSTGTGSQFNVTFSAGSVDSLWSYGATAYGNIAMDGTQGTSTGPDRWGTYTVNGTLVIADTLFLTSQDVTAGDTCTWVINGLVKTGVVIAGASAAATHTLTMNSGSVLQIVGTTAPYTTTFSTTNNIYNLYSGSTVEYETPGAQNIDNHVTYANLTVGGSGIKTASGTLNINGDLTINSPDTLVPNTAINIGGSWYDYGQQGFTETGSTVTFNGSGNQTIKVSPGGAPKGEVFVNVIVNKSSGYLILDGASNSEMTISNSLVLTSGIIIADTTNSGTNMVSFSTAGATVSGANDASFVYGRVSRLGNAPFTFPVGKGTEYRPISISGLSGTFTMRAQYFNINPDFATVPTSYNSTLVNAPIDSVSRCEYWTLQATTSGVSAKVTLSWDTYSCGVTDPSSLLVARDSTTASSWANFGNGSFTGTAAQGTVSSSSSVSFFNPTTYAFTLADTSLANPLPVSLLSFTAIVEQNDVLLKWTTASEVNNDYFTVERSDDAENFESLDNIKGAGNSTSEIYYVFIDNTPLTGISYYRLKQTDYNGNYTYSQTVAISYNKQQTPTITLFPNPTPDRAYINVSWETTPKTKVSNKTFTLHVFDVDGREVIPQQVINFSLGMVQVLDVTILPKGVYELQLNNDTEVQRASLVKE